MFIFCVFPNILRPFYDISHSFHCRLSTFLKCLVMKCSKGAGAPPLLAPKKFKLEIAFVSFYAYTIYIFFWVTFQDKNVHFLCIFKHLKACPTMVGTRKILKLDSIKCILCQKSFFFWATFPDKSIIFLHIFQHLKEKLKCCSNVAFGTFCA